jgi:DNA polymerase III delta prime subunit
MLAKILISDSLEERIGEIEKVLQKSGLTNPHPDLLYFPKDTKLGVEQAKEIREFFSIKPYQAKGKAVVLEDGGSLTIEAQNSLLKLLEEPPEEAILLLGAESEDKFLPTILSRCEIIVIARSEATKQSFQEDIEKLISQDIADRFAYIEKLKEKEEFLHALTYFFHSKLPKKEAAEFLKELIQAEEWAASNVNLRGILEYLMLNLPTNDRRK